MAPKKDKGKSQALVLKSESNLVSPITATELANRFAPLGSEYPIASYSSTLITPYDPFADVSQKSRFTGTPFKKPSGYVLLPFSQQLFSIEPERSNVKSACALALSYFPNGFHWIPEHPLKTLTFYSNILTQTKSVVIRPIYDQIGSTPKKIIYHSVRFLKVISEKDWGDHPSSFRKLDGNFGVHFNYYDYIDAWSKFMLYQTAVMDHSWFITFDKEHTCGILPVWFSQWWSRFGLIPDVLPLNLIESFELFKTVFKVDAYGSNFPHILHFTKQYRLPWIVKWQYVIVGNRLERHWYVKWWDKFAADPIIGRVKQLIQAPGAQNVPLPSIVPKLITPDDIGHSSKMALPNVDSPTSSSTLSKKEKKKALLKAMIESYNDSDDDDDATSEASSAPIDPQRNYFGNSGFDSPDNVPGLEDL